MKFFRSKTITGYSNRRGQNILHFWAHQGDHLPIESVVRMGVDPNKADQDGMTPLHFAALSGHQKVIDALIAAGADPTRLTNSGKTLAEVARLGGHNEIASFLEQRSSRAVKPSQAPPPKFG